MKMRVRVLSAAVGVLAFVSSFGVKAAGQVNDRVAGTWGSPGLSSSIARGLRERRGRAAAAADTSAAKFTPGVDSGVAKALADALGSSPQERAALAEAFAQLKQGYEAEVAKQGKSNNLAAALAFFIAANVAAYRQSEMPSDSATELLFGELQAVIAGAPESTATLRNGAGVVRQSKNNQLEKVTYGWGLHFFEGIGETNLVLRPARQTARDGGFSANSDFPNSYLYSQNGNLEWRF